MAYVMTYPQKWYEQCLYAYDVFESFKTTKNLLSIVQRLHAFTVTAFRAGKIWNMDWNNSRFWWVCALTDMLNKVGCDGDLIESGHCTIHGDAWHDLNTSE